jgi:hypothetical protein
VSCASCHVDSTPPSPRINEVLHHVASVVVTSTTVAPTMRCGASGLRSTSRTYLPIRQTVSSGRMIATGGFCHIEPNTYHLASAPITHTWTVPVGTINLFVGSPEPLIQARFVLAYRTILTCPAISSRPLSRSRGTHSLRTTRPWSTTASVARSITVVSVAESIIPVSNPGDLEDYSILSIFDYKSELNSVERPPSNTKPPCLRPATTCHLWIHSPRCSRQR